MKKIGIIVIFLLIGAESYVLISSLPKQNASSYRISSCTDAACWEQFVTEVIRDESVDSAMQSLAYAYDANPSFGNTCHDLTHLVGRISYDEFRKGGNITVSPKTAYCSYGFYHGFMEMLVSRGGDMDVARRFCRMADEQISHLSPDAIYQCFHGIGHGTVNNHDPANWGNEQAMINPAIALCEGVSETDEELSRCATGVFNGIAVFYGTGEYNLTIRKEDPLWICRSQKEQYKDACYISLNVALLGLTGGNLSRAAEFLEDIPEDIYAQHAMINLAAPVGTGNIQTSDHSQAISVCRTIQKRLQLSCIAGYAYGFLEQGKPNEEYKKPLSFCSAEALTQEERRACYDYIFSYLPKWYSQEKVRDICLSVELDERDRCLRAVSVETKE